MATRVHRYVVVAAVPALLWPVAFQAAVPPQPAASTPVSCDLAALQRRAPADTTITAARVVEATAGQPRHCLVDGHVTVPGNTVNLRVALPDGWNGKFYFQGVGGLGGAIGPLGAGLVRGYASASTDTGHVSSDPTWGQNRAKELDYGHRGTHVTAVAAKALTASFYGRPLAHAYFNGCSNGGRQALMEVQRYPGDFDGVIAGDPATGTPMQVGRAVFFQQLLATPENYVPVEKIGQHVERVHAGPAGTVMHAGHEVGARERVGRGLPADDPRHRVDVVQRAIGADAGVGPAVIHEQLPARLLERSQVGVERTQNAGHRLQARQILRKSERAP